ncbi:T9SS type A sorting domain-containing protein [Hymenobacter terricola]|uniref:T9SS type A sorting domain-containing protein n=1 Tax=Hymenobacter terricola TaxID=2819236 RepID=UPI001B30C635|nr:T9SS type A sorting domain-containing protein [Hymenobacter terricola]
MKKIVLYFCITLASSALAATNAQAQQAVSNGAMETWTTRNGGDAPDLWRTTDDVLQTQLPGFPPTISVIKSTTPHAGSFAAQLTSQNTFAGAVPGFMVLGAGLGNVSNVDSLVQLGGLPYTSRPARMQFYYRFAGTIATPDDRPLARVMLTKTTGGVRQVVATGRLYLTAAAAYTLADLPLRYRLGVAPDSIHIAFGSGDFDGGSFSVGNTLLVDDIAMTGTAAATRDAQLQAAVSAYPNPSASGLFTLAGPQDPTLPAAPFTVTDALGRVVLQQAAQPASGPAGRIIDLRPQPAGLYVLRLDTSRGQIIKQLQIN